MSDRDLFDHAAEESIRREAPLAARMRPRTLDEFVGQEHIVGPGRLLRRAIQADQLSSLIFYGPPGSGKTTLAMVIANTTRSHFVTINAVLAGVQRIREVTADARERRKLYQRRTILFVDEVHRWDKRQQDALLPWVENGTIIMIGATTENPWFSVNKALLSRSRVFQLVRLEEEHLREIARRALNDPERGYGQRDVIITPEALEHLTDVANGDARSVLNALELAVETTPPDDEGRIVIDLAVAEESIQRRAVLYDRQGDYHFDAISAFIKSLRGSDPDAALYWLAKMVYAGEDPRFIFRRMLIAACEDVGLADPDAIRVVVADAEAFDRVGLPEGRFHLAHAALYLATAAKSNSVMGFFDALDTVEHEAEGDVPIHLKDASRDREGFGHGEGYLYPHAYRDHWVAQQYLPDHLQGKLFYEPSDQGYEAQVRERVLRRREAQLAAMLDVEDQPSEILTFSPGDRVRDRWLQRTVGNVGEALEAIRDRVLSARDLARHDLILDLSGDSGLLTWEALRRVPEGGVWCRVPTARAAEAMAQQAEPLDPLQRPIIIEATLPSLQQALAAEGHGAVRFDLIVGRNVLGGSADKQGIVDGLVSLLAEGGVLSLAEVVPSATQRLSALLPEGAVSPDVLDRWRAAEEAVYHDPRNPKASWRAEDLREVFEDAGLSDVRLDTEMWRREQMLTKQQLMTWFALGQSSSSYADRLMAAGLPRADLDTIRQACLVHLGDRAVPWRTTTAFVAGRRST
ncbi:MAG: AAA family ATPase [Anaerolineae bacterium]